MRLPDKQCRLPPILPKITISEYGGFMTSGNCTGDSQVPLL